MKQYSDQTKQFLVIVFIAYLTVLLTSPIAHAQKWHEIKGEHFIVYLTGDKQFGTEVLNEAERYYKEIAAELGYQRYSKFWTWDNRVKIYIYPDQSSFLKATQQPQWSEGIADYTKKSISSYAWNEGFVDDLLSHEIAHLVFRDYVGFKGEVPLWLDEGVAQWMESKKRDGVRLAVQELAKNGNIIPLPELLKLDVRLKGSDQLVRIYYIEAVSVVGFMITEYGSNNFMNFCRQLRDGKRLDQALRFIYPRDFRSVEDLDKKWQEYIRKEK